MGNVEEMCGKKKNLEIETERRGINLTLFGDRRKKVFCELLVLIVLFVRTNFEMCGQKWLVVDAIFFLELASL